MENTMTADQERKLKSLKEKCSEFNHEIQITLCSKLIKAVLENLGEIELENIKKKKISDIDLSTRKRLIKTLIRHSSESSNHQATVDFVTIAALETANNKAILSHEHMVPCEDVFRRILDLRKTKKDAELTDMMVKAGFRALIYRGDKRSANTEHNRLGGELTSEMPKSLPPDFPLEYYPFARYEAAGIFSSLIGVSKRGIELLELYKKARPEYLDENGQWMYMNKPCQPTS